MFENSQFNCSLEEKKYASAKNGLFIAAKYLIKNTQKNCCIDGIEGLNHQAETESQIHTNPEVITLNLAWNDEPLPTDILHILISLP